MPTLVLVCLFSGMLQLEGNIHDANKALGRGINLGNALEAPRGQNWGVTIEDEYFKLIKNAGFQHIRLPVRWNDYADKNPPYAIEGDFFKKIDRLLDLAEKAGLYVVLNIHHYDELNKDPQGQTERFFELWKQIANRYQNQPKTLYFELNNEPHDQLKENEWNSILQKGLAAVRQSNPTRPVIIGPAYWNGIWALPKLKLPDDQNIIVTVHCYNPFEFTHQGATWTDPKVRNIRDRKWEGTDKELLALRKELDQAASWGKANNRPIYLGEFGAYQNAPMESRIRWTKTMAREAETRGFSWAYWEFAAGFGVYDPSSKTWRDGLLKALIP
ncbi:MAG TPA: glycoside hydrolase family 5 protein [Gemmatales bacterium]|nr:glycoside hydrolase family 5 protein [Gemmatales bacterium]HMP16141.1 glycoside hydrolase family 5 protein [Gemmatales bacterium]